MRWHIVTIGKVSTSDSSIGMFRIKIEKKKEEEEILLHFAIRVRDLFIGWHDMALITS